MDSYHIHIERRDRHQTFYTSYYKVYDEVNPAGNQVMLFKPVQRGDPLQIVRSTDGVMTATYQGVDCDVIEFWRNNN